MKNLSTKYNHKEVEEGLYETWLEGDYFKAGGINNNPYTIVIPPPNVTGKLHLGHAWDNAIQDILARYKRLRGYDVLYLPGMDHAGIATQAKVDEKLKNDGLSRYDLGREKFLERAWEWKKEYASHIRSQWAKTGISLDYSRERFTLDEGLNKAVNKVFVSLYKEGLIYQDYKIINWDPVAKTALSNIEVYHQDDPGKMYYFNYRVKENNKTFTVATTRPETMFGDVCIVVHPKDERYQDLIGLHAINPANDKEIPIIADDYIDISFGSGAMKCTPAHDPNDFLIAERHQLEKPICMNPDGTMNDLALKYEGLDRYECRDRLVEEIKDKGNLIKIEDIIHPVGHSERTKAVVEPYLSKQWFVRMKPLAKEVLDKQKNLDTKINFYPARYEKTFIQWLENIEDWCISRQLWWGHRIPAYYHKETSEIYVEENPPQDLDMYIQDEDVLDTWFSSALWPFSTLGWPENTEDLSRYYPTSCMVTGYDIIFFWVARMAIMGRHFTDSYPFKDCLIHGLTRDASGRKMSKSLGNGIDPLEVKEKYGVDALRFFLTTGSAPGMDIRYQEEKVESSWNFINKLWNASRFVLMNLPEDYSFNKLDLDNLNDIDKWIIDKFNRVLTSVSENMDKYEFSIVGNELYNFVWEDFCNWYIELCKSNLSGENSKNTLDTLYFILKAILRMIHPFIPFVSERIYQALPGSKESINIETWPSLLDTKDYSGAKVEQLISIIKTLREVKVENSLKPSTALNILVYDREDNVIEVYKDVILKMTKCLVSEKLDGEISIRPIKDGKLGILSSQLIDRASEIEKLSKQKISLEAEIKRSTAMLSNENFVSKAPKEKVQLEKDKLDNYKKDYDVVCNRLNELEKDV